MTTGGVVSADGTPVPFAEVNDLVQQIVKSARAHQIYDVSNPVYQRFLSNLRDTFAKMWTRTSELYFDLTDDGMVWEGQRIVPGDAY